MTIVRPVVDDNESTVLAIDSLVRVLTRTQIETFVSTLRSIGVPVSTPQVSDAISALALIDPAAPGVLRTMLTATLLRDVTHVRPFSVLFDLFFGSIDNHAAVHERRVNTRWTLRTLNNDELVELLIAVAVTEDTTLLSHVATEVVDRHTVIDTAAPVAGTLYVFQVLRALRLDHRAEELVGHEEAVADSSASGIRRRLDRQKIARRLRMVEQAIETEVRSRLVVDRGAPAVAAAVRTSVPADLDLATASNIELGELRNAMSRFPALLAAKLRHLGTNSRPGQVDVRRTVKASVSTGGTPLTLQRRLRRQPVTRIFVLADISGSVATYARFTLHLIFALRGEFKQVRSFAFIDGIDEISELVGASRTAIELAEALDAARAGIAVDGHSDYGRVFSSFSDRWLPEIPPHSTILIVGDGRSNHRPPEADRLRQITRRASRTFWLNPELSNGWGSGDSQIPVYAPHCDAVIECRTIRDFSDFVDSIV